jgi:hypothetical protein
MSTQPDDWTMISRALPKYDRLIEVVLTPGSITRRNQKTFKAVRRLDFLGEFFRVQVVGEFDYGVKQGRHAIKLWRYIDGELFDAEIHIPYDP